MTENKKTTKVDIIKGLLQKLDFLLHDTEFFIYQHLKMAEWIAPDDQQTISDVELTRLDNELSANFRKQHDLITEFLKQININTEEMYKLATDKNLQTNQDDQEMTPDKLKINVLDENNVIHEKELEEHLKDLEQLTLTRECEEQE